MVVFFPEELVYEILQRIPAKELLKFKMVCKQWRSIISEPKFADAHLRYCKQEDQIIIYSAMNLYPGYTFDSITMLENNMLRPMQVRYEDWLWLRYSCNGMLLLQDIRSGKLKNVTIYNPITHARKDLPPTPIECWTWALVHDASTRKYKVFAIDSTVESYVFTQGETDWIYLSKLATTAVRKELTVSKLICLENKLHWIASTKILGFDNAENAFSFYSLDVADHEEHIKRAKIPFEIQYQHYLSVATGYVYITNVLNNTASIETWVLKDMANNLWSKCCSIRYGSDIPFHGFVTPIDLEDSTRFLDQSKLIKYDYDYLSIYDMKGTRKIALKRSKRSKTGIYSPHINSLINWD